MDDNKKFIWITKAENVENAVKSENVEETLEAVLNENLITTKDVEKSSEQVDLDETKKGPFLLNSGGQ